MKETTVDLIQMSMAFVGVIIMTIWGCAWAIKL